MMELPPPGAEDESARVTGKGHRQRQNVTISRAAGLQAERPKPWPPWLLPRTPVPTSKPLQLAGRAAGALQDRTMSPLGSEVLCEVP